MTTTVLVIDDDSGIRDLLEFKLERNGFEAVVGANGEECLEYLRSNPLPDLVVLDVAMPGMDGIETFEAIDEEHGTDVPVVMLSGKSPDNRPTDGEIEPSAHLRKPFRMNEVISSIERVLDRDST
jgi:two-component system response regulator VicR